MIKSMTAFGRAVGGADGKAFTCEIRSVNNRYLDCSVKLPRAYGFLEEKIIAFVKESGVSRGKIEIGVGVEVTDSVGTEIELDEGYARGYVAALRRLRDEFGLADDISVSTVAANRELFLVKKPTEDADRDWAAFLPVLTEAVTAFQAAREAEGARLREDLLAKRRHLKELADRIGTLSAANTVSYRERLEARLRQTLADLNLEFDSQRILTECAIFADKIAVDEELVRLNSHFQAFDEAMDSDGPVGRRLDFLLQEMNREVNTTGSKSNDGEIASLVVDAKCELEKIREQIQNLE